MRQAMFLRALVRACATAGCLAAAAGVPAAPAHGVLDFDAAERERILAHGPWPQARTPDPTNRASGRGPAVAFGERLFFEPRLSSDRNMSCATCHVPARAWSDGRPTGFGHEPLDRNSPGLLDLAGRRWYGWDGAHDSLWSQSIRPLLHAQEMNGTAAGIARAVRGDPDLSCGHRASFGAVPDDDEQVLVNVGKALAAFQETLASGRSPFDRFRDALARGDLRTASAYPMAAQRGLRIFVGSGNCAVCHAGPRFSNGEFGDIGIRYFIAPGRVDSGRHGGIAALRDNPFNLLGRYNDQAATGVGDPDKDAALRATSTRHVSQEQRNFGEFRVPGLRNVSRTAPYMHNGSIATLEAVVRHYSELNEERLHADGERILRPLKLTPAQSADLLAFLRSLDAPYPGQSGRRAPAACQAAPRAGLPALPS